MLSHFLSLASTFVTCDASSTALFAVSSQEVDGQEKPIAYASRALTDATKKYSEGKREALACIWACDHWHVYLYGRQFTLRTDHQALKTLLSSSGTGRRPLRLHRWSDRLHQYTFTITYRPGSQNQVADCLSRTPKIFSGPASTSQEPVRLLTAPFDNIITLDELRRASENDDLLRQVCTFTINGWPCTIEYSLLWPFYQIRDELSVWNDSCLARGERAVISASLQQKVFSMAHESHSGMVKTKQTCRNSVWWPGIDKQIEDHFRSCEACIQSGKSIKPTKSPLNPVKWPKQP